MVEVELLDPPAPVVWEAFGVPVGAVEAPEVPTEAAPVAATGAVPTWPLVATDDEPEGAGDVVAADGLLEVPAVVAVVCCCPTG